MICNLGLPLASRGIPGQLLEFSGGTSVLSSVKWEYTSPPHPPIRGFTVHGFGYLWSTEVQNSKWNIPEINNS